MVPTATAVNLSTIVAPTPTPPPVQPCSITVSDLTLGVPNAWSACTCFVPAAGKHQVSLTLASPFATNSVAVNGSVPSGWSALAPGEIAVVVVDVVGVWTFVVTTPGATPNSVTIQGY
jgi:hypothetical protein